MDWWQVVLDLPYSGWMGLLDYLAAHVLLCLLPAFVIAGYISAMIPKEAITRYLGPNARKWISYPAAAAGGSSWQFDRVRSCRCLQASGSAAQGWGRRLRFCS